MGLFSLFGRKTDERRQLREEVELASLRMQKRLLEANINWYDNIVNPLEPLWDDQDFWAPLGPNENVPLMLNNRGRGEVLPIYITEYGLKILRDQSRSLCAFNPFALNALGNRVAYTVGKGFKYTAVRKDAIGVDSEMDPLCRAVQDVIDEFRQRTSWAEREQEAVRRFDRDGDTFIRFFHVGGGYTETRFTEPEWIHSPDGVQHNDFGIQSPPDDVEDVTGYWVVEEPAISYAPSLVPAEQMLHIKANSDKTSKRGVPTFIPVRKNLMRADALLRNMSMLAQIQATFAVIRKHKQFSASAVSAFQQAQADATVQMPLTGKTAYIQQLQPGSIIDAPEQTEYEFPGAKVDGGGLVAILQAELRAIAARLNLPEYMLTADASNANYSSTMVAESPAVKGFEMLQSMFARAFGDGSYGTNPARAGAMWRVVANAVEWGRLPPNALTDIEIQVEGPSLVVRDKAQETSRAAQLNSSGVLSKHTWASQEGLDYDQEQRFIEEETAATPAGPEMGGEPVPGIEPEPGQADGVIPGDAPLPEAMRDQSGRFMSTKGPRRRWVAHPGCCAECRMFDGKVRGLGKRFGFTSKGAPVYNPPLHPNCECTLELVTDTTESVQPNKTGHGCHDTETGHPAPCDGSDAAGTNQRGGAKKNFVHRNEEIAHSTYRSVVSVLSKVQSGKLDTQAARNQLTAAYDKATAENKKNWVRRYQELHRAAAGVYGEHAMASPEWKEIRKSFGDGMRDAERYILSTYKDAINGLNHWRDHGIWPTTPYGKSFLKDALAEYHNDMVSAGDTAVADISNAVVAFKKAHRPVHEGVAAEPLARLLEDGFTGQKKDKSGRTRCYSSGKLVDCPSSTHAREMKPATAKLPNGQTVTFTLHEKDDPKTHTLIFVDPKRLDAAWKKDHGYYLPSGEKGKSEVAGRRDEFKRFLATGKPVQAPRVSVGTNGDLNIEDGRHRLAVLRDMGINRVGLSVPKGEVSALQKLLAAR